MYVSKPQILLPHDDLIKQKMTLPKERSPTGGPVGTTVARASPLKMHPRRYVINRRRVGSVLINFLAIIIGVIIAIGSSLQQSYITGLRFIDVWDIIILFAIGLGIDKIKQIVSKLLLKLK
jgi:hypothetical protein